VPVTCGWVHSVTSDGRRVEELPPLLVGRLCGEAVMQVRPTCAPPVSPPFVHGAYLAQSVRRRPTALASPAVCCSLAN
jgi:hypothetical protein